MLKSVPVSSLPTPGKPIVNCISRIFQPVTQEFSDGLNVGVSSQSQKLMLQLGLMKHAVNGCYYLLPMGVRALEKLTHLVEKHMQKIRGQKVQLPTLLHQKLWDVSQRYSAESDEVFRLKDRHDKQYILSPTCEESLCDLLSAFPPTSARNYPLKLYQISYKFRDEMRPRYGLIRSRQFLMKDMYSFDVNLKGAQNTYEEICDSYEMIFKTIGVPYTKTVGVNGEMGGTLSHEFHYHTMDIGEDHIAKCSKCNHAVNAKLLKDTTQCTNCNQELEMSMGIEVGHTFLLEDRYTSPFRLYGPDMKKIPLQMGSYGLGLTRILATSLEVLSYNKNVLRWPTVFVPYKCLLLPPKAGSAESAITDYSVVEDLYKKIERIPGMSDDILVDDRINLTLGKRFHVGNTMGYPYIIIMGKMLKETPPLYEIFNTRREERHFFSQEQLLNYIEEDLKVTSQSNS